MPRFPLQSSRLAEDLKRRENQKLKGTNQSSDKLINVDLASGDVDCVIDPFGIGVRSGRQLTFTQRSPISRR